MSLLDELAEGLARDTLAAMDEIGDDRYYEKVSRVIGELSPTLQEGFMTAMRLRLAERRGREFLGRTLASHRTETGREP